MTRPQPPILRAVLYVPAANTRALARARTLACDALIFDLEDAVGPEQKDEARIALVEALQAGGFAAPLRVVRVNGLDTPWAEADLAALGACAPDAVLIPKVCGAADLQAWRGRLDAALPEESSPIALWAMVETCAAVLNLAELAGAAARVGLAALVMGLEDLTREMRCRPGPDRLPLTSAMSCAIAAARAAGLAIVDGVFTGVGDLEGLARECRQGRDLGFDGKSLIHPEQVEAAIRTFSPSPEEVAWARRVVEAFARPEAAGRGVLKLDGRMVERLHLSEAERVLRIDGARSV